MSLLILSQNLIINGDFETYSNIPLDYGQIHNTINWRNVHGRTSNFTPIGTPGGRPWASADYFHHNVLYAGYTCSIVPKSGLGQAGIYLYNNYLTNSSTINSTEYITSKLRDSLTIGKSYRLIFHITSGIRTYYSGCRSGYMNNIGAHFSKDTLKQNLNYVINVTPQVNINNIIYSANEWTKYTLKFTADNASKYITIGRFYPDNLTTVLGVGHYYYFDDIYLFPDLYIHGDSAICKGDSAILTAKNDMSFAWALSTKKDSIISTDSILRVLPNTSATYILYGSGDTLSHHIKVIDNAPVLHIGSDTTICYDDTLVLKPNINNVEYLWSDGSKDDHISISREGKFWLKVNNACGSAADTMNVGIKYQPPQNIINDTTLCESDTISLNSTSDYYFYINNSKKNNIKFSNPGTYILDVKNECAVVSDTFRLNVIQAPYIDLGYDRIICGKKQITLKLSKNEYKKKWFDGSVNDSVPIYQSGTYYATVSNMCGVDTDSIKIDFADLPSVPFLKKYILCLGEATVFDTSKYDNIEWKEYKNISDSINQRNYIIKTSNKCGYRIDTTIILYIECNPENVQNNIFTPNNDGNNDTFSVISASNIVSKLMIMNRYGTIIYQDENLHPSWDGTVDGYNAPDGVYFWHIEYKTLPSYYKKGYLLLVR
ncbi:MAG: gliding motility-associated C-terminal domain-containing protein [Cytophagales bacterium]|nr:gliding motility-associated C-terminal domain-containing protein [Cytophagales bacterium]